jgi:hypothetical protein
MKATAVHLLSPSGRRPVRFPCGHTDLEHRVVRRLRERGNALWVGCARCNVIAISVVASTGRRPARRSARYNRAR